MCDDIVPAEHFMVVLVVIVLAVVLKNAGEEIMLEQIVG